MNELNDGADDGGVGLIQRLTHVQGDPQRVAALIRAIYKERGEGWVRAADLVEVIAKIGWGTHAFSAIGRLMMDLSKEEPPYVEQRKSSGAEAKGNLYRLTERGATLARPKSEPAAASPLAAAASTRAGDAHSLQTYDEILEQLDAELRAIEEAPGGALSSIATRLEAYESGLDLLRRAHEKLRAEEDRLLERFDAEKQAARAALDALPRREPSST